MANNIYRFRRLKWGAPKRFKAMPTRTRPAAFGWEMLAISIGVVVIGTVLYFLI